MYVVLKRSWRGYPAEKPIDMPASDARSALSTGVAVHATEWKERQRPETATQRPPENAAARTRRPEEEPGVCGATKASGGMCQRETEDGGRCWQHAEDE